jgi:pimeloyl-ACP methyl ester carboxylesterase
MQIDGMDIHHSVMGDGHPLLFLHGWGVGYESYLPLLTKLAETHTVYAPDMPGFGKTPEPDAPWDADRYADFIASYCGANGLSEPVCMGHSNGGRVLLRLLSRDLPGIKPPRMVLFGPAGLKVRRGLKYFVKVYTYKAGKLLLTPFPGVLEKYRAGKGSADYQSASPLMKETMKILLQTDLTDALLKIRIPTLLVWGKDDTAVPLEDGRRMERLIPDSGLAVMPGGHWAFMENVPHTLRILDHFL